MASIVSGSGSGTFTYDSGSGNILFSGNWLGSIAVSAGEVLTTAIVIRNWNAAIDNTNYNTVFSSGLFKQVSSQVFTSSQTYNIYSFSGSLTKSQYYNYITNAGGAAYVTELASLTTTSGIGSGAQVKNLTATVPLPSLSKAAAVDQDRSFGYTGNFFLISYNVTPIASAPVLGVTFSVCGNALSWSTSTNADGYKVWRSTNGSSYSLLATNVGINNTTYQDNTAVLGTTYWYKIESYNSTWFEDAYTNKSNVVNGVSSYTAPSLTSLVGTECTMTNSLTWSDNSTCETGYRVLKSTNGTTYSLLASLAAGTTSYVDTAVNVNQIYYYRIATDFSQFGLSYTGASSNNTLTFSAPSSVSVVRQTAISLGISWTLNTTCESAVLLERRVGTGGTWIQIADLPTGTLSYEDYNVIDGYTYYYRVRVEKAVTSQYSSYSSEASLLFDSFYIYQGANAAIRTIELDADDKPAIGGDFTTYYDGTSANRIASLNTLGTFNTTFAYGTGFNGTVYKVVYDSINDVYYVGGSFTTYQGTAANRIISLNPDGSKNSGFNNTTGFDTGTVFDLALDNNGKLYCVGSFTAYKGVGAWRAIRLNPDGTRDTGFTISNSFATGFNNTVYSVAVEPSTNNIYFGGAFTNYKNYTNPYGYGLNRVAKIDEFGAVITGWTSGLTTSLVSNTVFTILIDSSENVFFGGDFTFYRGTSVGRAVKVFKNTGAVDTTWNMSSLGGFNGTVRKFVLDPVESNRMFVAGDFTVLNGNNAPKITKIAPSNATPDLTFGSNVGSGFNAITYDLHFDDDNNLYVVGDFTTYQGNSFNRIIKLTRDGLSNLTYNTVAANQTTLTIVSGTSATDTLLNWYTIGVQLYSGNTIYRRKYSELAFSAITQVSSGTTSYTVSEVIDDDYEYRIISNKLSGASESNYLTLPFINFTTNVNRSVENQLDLSWTNTSTYVTSIQIFRSVDSGSTYSLFSNIGLTTSYNNSSLIEDTIYFYRFKYKNGNSVTTYFNDPASGITYLNTPTMLSIDQPVNGVKQFDLTWVNNSSKQTGFEVYRRVYNTGSFVLIDTVTGTTYSDTGVTTFGETYEYYVKAVRSTNGNESLPSVYANRTLENVSLVLSYNVTVDDNQVDRNINLSWIMNGNCTGTTFSIYKSYDGINFSLLNTTTAYTYTDEERFEKCQDCSILYYYVTIYCINLIESNTVEVIIEPVESDWNLGGLERLWIAPVTEPIYYNVVNATYKTLQYYGNNIQTISQFLNGLNWYELPVYPDNQYTQKMVKSDQGIVFEESLSLTIPKFSPSKWSDMQTVLGNEWLIVFKDLNGKYCTMGYATPAIVSSYKAGTEDSKYDLTFTVKDNYNLMKFVSESYVVNFIL